VLFSVFANDTTCLERAWTAQLLSEFHVVDRAMLDTDRLYTVTKVCLALFVVLSVVGAFPVRIADAGKITLAQRAFASRRLFPVWITFATVLCVVYAVRVTGTYPASLTDWRGLLLLLGAVVLGGLLGPPVGVLTAWFVLGPIAHAQAVANGAPFSVGDRVVVISGPHRGKTLSIYEVWDRGDVRLELGESARSDFSDRFSSTEVFRASKD